MSLQETVLKLLQSGERCDKRDEKLEDSLVEVSPLLQK